MAKEPETLEEIIDMLKEAGPGTWWEIPFLDVPQQLVGDIGTAQGSGVGPLVVAGFKDEQGTSCRWSCTVGRPFVRAVHPAHQRAAERATEAIANHLHVGDWVWGTGPMVPLQTFRQETVYAIVLAAVIEAKAGDA